MSADPLVEVLRDDETLLRTRSSAKRGREVRKGFAEPRSCGCRRRNTAAPKSPAGCSRKLPASPAQGVSRTVPGRRNSSHGARADAAARFSRCPSEPSTTRKLQPATSATAAVSSREPASAISTSVIRPAVAPGTSADKRRHQRPFRIPRCDDDAQHVAADRGAPASKVCGSRRLTAKDRVPRLVSVSSRRIVLVLFYRRISSS